MAPGDPWGRRAAKGAGGARHVPHIGPEEAALGEKRNWRFAVRICVAFRRKPNRVWDQAAVAGFWDTGVAFPHRPGPAL